MCRLSGRWLSSNDLPCVVSLEWGCLWGENYKIVILFISLRFDWIVLMWGKVPNIDLKLHLFTRPLLSWQITVETIRAYQYQTNGRFPTELPPGPPQREINSPNMAVIASMIYPLGPAPDRFTWKWANCWAEGGGVKGSFGRISTKQTPN